MKKFNLGDFILDHSEMIDNIFFLFFGFIFVAMFGSFAIDNYNKGNEEMTILSIFCAIPFLIVEIFLIIDIIIENKK